MPQQRQRIVFCDCLDCVQQPPTTDIASSSSPANEAVARQEPPPKCLMFALSGVLLPSQSQTANETDTLLDSCNIPHINRATAQGNLCLLTVRQDSPTGCQSEVAQLLGVYQALSLVLLCSDEPCIPDSPHGHHAASSVQDTDIQSQQQPASLADRFKGMQASFASNSSAACELAAACGMASSNVLQKDTEARDSTSSTANSNLDGQADGDLMAEFTGAAVRQRHAGTDAAATAEALVKQRLPDPAEAARRILLELGLQQPEAGLDMLLVHVDTQSLQQPPQQQQQVAGATAAAVLTWLDRTLRYLNNSSAFKDTVLLTVLATPGAAGQLPAAVPMLTEHAGGLPIVFQSQQPIAESRDSSIDQNAAHNTPAMKQASGSQWVIAAEGQQVLRPLQSWQQLGGKLLDIDPQRPIMCLRRLPGVIRRDACSRFSLKDCCSSSAGLGLLVDRLIPEIAYKLGRAPKYGA